MNNHQIKRYRCACGCGQIAPCFRITPTDDGEGRYVAVLKEHVEKFGKVLAKRDEMREFIHNHNRRGFLGWFHRLRWARAFHRLHRHCHNSGSGEAVLCWLSPNRLANWIAR